MFRKIEDFLSAYADDSSMTKKYMSLLTDESLAQSVADGHRTLGRMAWHLAQTIPEMMAKTGLTAEGPGEQDPVPATAAEIAAAYRLAADSLLAQVKEHWTDESLLEEDEMYGSKWSRGFTLHCLSDHETHHRGQMSVLMRQAGLTVPGTMGPAKEEWVNMGMEAPEI
jgi:uncharacterized damage-inducible protein DinB